VTKSVGSPVETMKSGSSVVLATFNVFYSFISPFIYYYRKWVKDVTLVQGKRF
jgi:hypothetical protein